MPTAKDIAVALCYLQSECYRAGFAETGYLIEVARLSLEEDKHPRRADAPANKRKNGSPRRLQA